MEKDATMKKTQLVAGSFAYDRICAHPGLFQDALSPDKLHVISVSFNLPKMRLEFGGTGGNIAWALSGLGDEVIALGAMGAEDGPRYIERLEKRGVSAKFIHLEPGASCSQALIFTDEKNNQITGYHPGAQEQSGKADALGAAREAKKAGALWAIVSVDDKGAMIQRVRLFKAEGLKVIFDPGQALPMFCKEELGECAALADMCVLNDYEADLWDKKTGQKPFGENSLGSALGAKGGALIVTLGAKGALLCASASGLAEREEAAQALKVEDPTGCGDAFRAGLLHALSRGASWIGALRLGSAMGAIQVGFPGGQNHQATLEEALSKVEISYGEEAAQELRSLSARGAKMKAR